MSIHLENAAVFVTVYDRQIHFKSCIESLLANPQANDTVVYISSDGPKDDISRERVDNIRNFIKTIRGSKKVVLCAPNENTGGEIRFETLKRLKDNHKFYIITEDDNIFSPYSLAFFNDAFRIYQDDPSIFYVCGYIPPGLVLPPGQTLLLPYPNGWGLGFWRDKGDLLDLDYVKLAKSFLNNKIATKKANKMIPHLIPLSIEAAQGELPAGDVAATHYTLLNNLNCIYPSQTLVVNRGYDGSGLHCGPNNTIQTQLLANIPILVLKGIEIRLSIKEIAKFERFMSGTLSVFRNKVLISRYRTRNNLLLNILYSVVLDGFRLLKRSVNIFGNKDSHP